MSDLISRQAAIDAVCAVCGNDCDKSEFVYNAPQDEQVILCPEHYVLCTLPSAQSDYDKQSLIKYIRAGIVATNTKDIYSCGMRNGMRWCKSLLEDNKCPTFEDSSQYAQPKIIICKDCKWWDSVDGERGYCMAVKHSYMSRNWDIDIRRRYPADFYCADAERREDGNQRKENEGCNR